MRQKPGIALANGEIITVERATLLPSGVLEVDDGEKTYYLSQGGWWSYEPATRTSAYEDHGLTTI